MYLSDRTGKLNARMLKGPNPSGPIAQVHHHTTSGAVRKPPAPEFPDPGWPG
jgi:hypothetical protein